MSTPTFLGRINSSQKCNFSQKVSEGQYFAVSQGLAKHISHILRSEVARVVGLLLGTMGSNMCREKQHPNHHI